MNKYQFGKITIITPDVWKDITDSIDKTGPLTLAKDDGFGALQFSVAQYHHGGYPNIKISDLRALRISFSKNRKLGKPLDEYDLDEKNMISSGSYHVGDDYVKVWYCSDGASIALVTFVASWGMQGSEPLESDSIIEQIKFK